MIAIEVNFLTGRYCAASHHDRRQPEWPPHGARLFSAMVAAWADCEPTDDAEREALEWLESRPPPQISAPNVIPRSVVSHFVPVNDVGVISTSPYHTRFSSIRDLLTQWDEEKTSAGRFTPKSKRIRRGIDKKRDVSSIVKFTKDSKQALKDAQALMPEGRVKKERFFPSVTLAPSCESGSDDAGTATVRCGHSPPVVYSWSEDPKPEIAVALDRLLSRVTRLGHSSSLVSCRLRVRQAEPTYLPGRGPVILRWVRTGQLEALEREHERHLGVRVRHLPSVAVPYRELRPRHDRSRQASTPKTAGDWIVFELLPRHRSLPMTRTVEVTRLLRDSLLSHARDPLPEGLSGHCSNGSPTKKPHVSFLALPNVGHEFGDGRLMGLAVSLPNDLESLARTVTLAGIGAWERAQGGESLRLTMGRHGVVEIVRRQGPHALVSLRRGLWARQSRSWVSVSPVALPKHPGNFGKGSYSKRARAWRRAEELVADSCEHVGLPRPARVQVSLNPYVTGARPVRDFPSFRQGRGQGFIRRLVHAAVDFDQPVRGPLLLGSGRFLGLGLMRPSQSPSKAENAGRTKVKGGSDE